MRQALNPGFPKGCAAGLSSVLFLDACQARNHCCSADVCSPLTGGQRQKTSMIIAFAFQMSTLFLIKNKKMFCANCHVSNEPGAASLATLNPADTRSYEARYQSCGVSTVA